MLIRTLKHVMTCKLKNKKKISPERNRNLNERKDININQKYNAISAMTKKLGAHSCIFCHEGKGVNSN